ncbi:MAG TPA: gluconate 2-dehydrogenase subunit 3 family protein [Bryobacteraceae bacterium]|nr:gluconate 2-dehydrogenase subunit 3 family protein [Bryobacteraceae bacterium]
MADLLSRRDILMLLTGAAAALQLPAEPSSPLFFTNDEFRMLDTLTELIIPSDDHSPGARAAGVAAYIDRSLAEAYLPDERDSWRKGLSAINDLSVALYRCRFNESSATRQVELLTRIAKNERHPATPAERFFIKLKSMTASVYYTTEIGIHQEIQYLGNTLLEQYAGFDAK